MFLIVGGSVAIQLEFAAEFGELGPESADVACRTGLSGLPGERWNGGCGDRPEQQGG